MALAFTQGFPVWTVDTLPKQWAEAIKEDADIKPWKNCSHCFRTPESLGRERFPRCQRCAHVRSADPPRYCSTDCQAQDWTLHQPYCARSLGLDKKFITTVSYDGPTHGCKLIRQAHRWVMGGSMVIRWAVRQAFRSRLREDFSNNYLNIYLNWLVPDNPQSPVWTPLFEFKSVDQMPQTDFPEDKTRPFGYFCLNYDRAISHFGWVYLDEHDDNVELFVDKDHNNRKEIHKIEGDNDSDDQNDEKDAETDRDNSVDNSTSMGVIRPQWPWILSHCMLMGDINPAVENIRLMVLLFTLDEYGDPHGHLEQFSAPPFSNKFVLTPESMDRWMQLMYPVVGSIRSRFHHPTTVIKDLYGFLLSQCRPRLNRHEHDSEDE